MRRRTTATNSTATPFVLIVEDDPTFASILLELAHEQGLKGVISSAGSGTVAMVRKMRPSAITLDLGLADIDGFVLLDLLRHDPDTARYPGPCHFRRRAGRTCADDRRCRSHREAGRPRPDCDAVPADRRIRADCQQEGQGTARRAGRRAKREAIPEIAGSRILIIDDDIRNIYSLTSVLEVHDVEVLHAERGAEGIAILQAEPDIDVALVDIMMPEMDGYETMRRIRATPALPMCRWSRLLPRR